jgi:hypothetical protein
MPDLVSPRTRGRILREIMKGREVQTTRRGIEMHFVLSDQPNFENERVEWRARIRRHWYSGKAGSVFVAIQEIEREADKPR